MASVAIIGPDGAGKTTLTRMLENSGIQPFRYMYMGVDQKASNIALPTSRLFHRFKTRQRAHRNEPPAGRPQRSSLRRSVRGMLRLIGLLTEEWFRQLVSCYYQLRGYTVLYDRHFVFDFAPEFAGITAEPLDKKLQRWFLRHLYPRPGLVLFLDAPGPLLSARKGESTPDELERRRQLFLSHGRAMPRFVRIDATRPVAEVYAEVAWHVLQFTAQPQRHDAAPAAR